MGASAAWDLSFVAPQGLNLTPASFSLTAGAGANASIAGITNVTNSAVADLYMYIAEVQVDSSYQVNMKALADGTEQLHKCYGLEGRSHEYLHNSLHTCSHLWARKCLQNEVVALSRVMQAAESWGPVSDSALL
jgi:hypothetical protein